MRTLLSKFLIFFLCFQVMFPFCNFAFAQEAQKEKEPCESNPPVCSATPASMQLYLDFQKEIAALLQATPFETATAAISQ